MTKEEAIEAMGIIDEYDRLSKELQATIDSLVEIEGRKDDLMERLEKLKTHELDFMTKYKEKYGNRDLLQDLNSEANP